jgi:hypothetical protein
MPFTGRLGTQNSELGNIVLGIADSFEIGTFGFDVHVLASNLIRVRFDHAVTSETALVPSSYIITSLAPPFTAVVPTIDEVTFDSSDKKSVVLHLSEALTSNTLYSLQMVAILDDQGETVSGGAKNFLANVQDPPRVLGAYPSERGFIDVLFDRSVGPTSVAATANIRGISGGPGVAMTLVPWTTALPETTIRFQIPVATPIDVGYLIDLANVVDASLNTNSETTPLDLVLRAPTPYSFAILTQVQIIDAYVADVSNDIIDTATVRVYFNCNIDSAQSLNTLNWAVSVHSGHKNIDTVDFVFSPSAFDLPSLIILVNDLKAKINTHEVGAEIHYKDDTADLIITPDAFDGSSALALTIAVQTSFLNHLFQTDVHLYPDTFNTFAPIPVFDISTAITAANAVQSSFNKHLFPTYATFFSAAYMTGTPLGEIFPFASVLTSKAQNVAADTGSYNYFVDLHVFCPTNLASIDVSVLVQSEDLGSVTNMGDYTGSATARAGDSVAQVLSDSAFTDKFFELMFDRDVFAEASPVLENLITGIRSTGSLRKLSTLAGLVWTIDNLMFAYSEHIDLISGAGHQVPDTTNIVNSFNYVTHISLSELTAAANLLKNLFNVHMTSSTFHFNADNFVVTAPNALDFDSLMILVQNLREVFLHHNSSGSQTSPGGVVPTFSGIHSYPGFRVFSARLFNLLKIDVNNIQDGASYRLSIPITDSYHDNALNIDFLHNSNLSQDFVGIATRPSLASALPIIGFNPLDPERQLNFDAIQVFFSKPMFKEPITPTNLSLTGGSILVKDSSWVDDTTASMRVVNMTTILYNLQAIGLTDLAGNLIY